MNLNSLVDYLLYAIVRTLSLIFCLLPVEFVLAIGRILGTIGFYLDSKHKTIAYANLRCAFSQTKTPNQLKKITKNIFKNLGQNFVETLILPRIDVHYKNKYIQIEGLEHITEALKQGKGVILLGMHLGSWEVCNVAFGQILSNYAVLANEQKRYPRLNRLLDSYRALKGYEFIINDFSLRRIIDKLSQNRVMAIAVDQSGRDGLLVDFFGKSAPAATAAIRLALKFGAVSFPGFVFRKKGPYHKLVLEPPINLVKTQDLESDLLANLQVIYKIFQAKISEHPAEYFWFYKVWKYSDQRRIVILSDGKAGHLKQSEALLKVLAQLNYEIQAKTIEVRFKNKFSRRLLSLCAKFCGKHCQGCMSCLKFFLTGDSYNELMHSYTDIIISCGSSLAAVNLLFSKENLAKSIVILKPGILSADRFEFVIMPKHDKPPQRKNIIVIAGALNSIDEEYLREEALKLKPYLKYPEKSTLTLGLFVGGDTKRYKLSTEIIKTISRQIKDACQNLGAHILITTSRRTSPNVEHLLKEEFSNYPNCSLLVIANEENIKEAVGGILGLSDIVLVTSESISMLSEAVSAGKYVLALRLGNVSGRHNILLEDFVKQGYIRLIEPHQICNAIKEVWQQKPSIHELNNNSIVYEAIKKI